MSEPARELLNQVLYKAYLGSWSQMPPGEELDALVSERLQLPSARFSRDISDAWTLVDLMSRLFRVRTSSETKEVPSGCGGIYSATLTFRGVSKTATGDSAPHALSRLALLYSGGQPDV